jgi:hypothetical protein
LSKTFRAKFGILPAVTGDWLLLACAAVCLAQIDTNGSEKHTASIFMLDKDKGSISSETWIRIEQFTRSYIRKENNFQKYY